MSSKHTGEVGYPARPVARGLEGRTLVRPVAGGGVSPVKPVAWGRGYPGQDRIPPPSDSTKGQGVPPPPPRRTGHNTGGRPLAVTQEDFFVHTVSSPEMSTMILKKHLPDFYFVHCCQNL